MIKLGDKITVEKVFSPEEVVSYCKFIDCIAPYHLSAEGGKAYGFEDMVVPAMVAIAYTATLKELDYVDNLSLEISRSYTVVRPIYVNRKYIYYYKCVAFDEKTGIYALKISLKDEANRIYLICNYQLIYKK